MKKKIEQILNGKFEYEQPELLFSKDRLEITLEAGSTAQGELYFGTENNDRIQGYVTSSNRRFVPFGWELFLIFLKTCYYPLPKSLSKGEGLSVRSHFEYI